METWPPEPRATTTRLAWLVWGLTLRLEAVGTAEPAGKTVRKVPAVPLMAVTLRTTDWAPEGTDSPPTATPVTGKVIVASWPRRPSDEHSVPVLRRVSQIRKGCSAVYAVATG